MTTDIGRPGAKDLGFDPDELRAKYRAERDKRVRADASDQYQEVVAEFSHFVEDPYVEAGFTRAPVDDEVDVVVIGGGFGGLLASGRLREAGLERIRVIEKGGDFGGTWYWNRYPGAMCDVESYCYLPLLEEIGYIPKHKYSFAPEILEHSKAIARHYGLYEDALLQTSVKDMRWDEDNAHWVITTDRGDIMRSRYVAMSNGPLNRPKLPGIPGIADFEGHTFHTSRWDYDYTGGDSTGGLTKLAGKRVGIIGTGATAVQAIPHLGEWAEQLFVFQRTPSSVDVRANRETDPDWATTLEPGWQKARMENFNALVTGADQDVDLVADGWTDIMRNLTNIAAKKAAEELGRPLTSPERSQLMELADFQKMEQVRARAEAIVRDPDVAEVLKPFYRQFCKRPCFHDEYLDTYNRPNVTLVDTAGKGVERVTENAIVVDGTAYEVDCLIFATGFEVGTSYTRRAGYDVIGRGGEHLSDKWTDGPRTFHGLQTNGFPNCFFMGNTQTALTVNFTHLLDEQAKHIAYIVSEARDRGADVVEATEEAEQSWVDEIRQSSRIGAKFYADCTPGYYNSEGKEGNPSGFFANSYGAGPVALFQLMADWRSTGQLEGVELR